jgi:4-hydroxy-2-oxoglutarate aldolase
VPNDRQEAKAKSKAQKYIRRPKMTLKEKLTGIYPPVMTPFFEDGKIDYAGLKFNIEKMNQTKLRGYMPLGSNGEFRSLTDDESIEVLKVIYATKNKDKYLMAGAGRESAYATVEFIKRAADVGADFVSVLTPHYYAKKMTNEALINYFSKVADNSPIPVLMYCAPSFAAGVLLSFEAAGILAKHPNIVGMKDTSKEDIAQYVKAIPSGAEFFVLAGSVSKFLYALKNGAIGGVLSMSNYFPELCCELQEIFESGKLDDAEKMSIRLVSLNEKTTGKYGVAGVKAAMNFMGYKGGYPRIPLLPLKGADLDELASILKQEGFLK